MYNQYNDEENVIEATISFYGLNLIPRPNFFRDEFRNINVIFSLIFNDRWKKKNITIQPLHREIGNENIYIKFYWNPLPEFYFILYRKANTIDGSTETEYKFKDNFYKNKVVTKLCKILKIFTKISFVFW